MLTHVVSLLGLGDGFDRSPGLSFGVLCGWREALDGCLASTFGANGLASEVKALCEDAQILGWTMQGLG